MSVCLEEMFTETGPTREATDTLGDRGTLSSGQYLMLQAAFDVWNGRGGMPLGRALNVLDDRNLQAFATLLVAITMGSVDIELWISRQDRR